jgi:hypothetical protein
MRQKPRYKDAKDTKTKDKHRDKARQYKIRYKYMRDKPLFERGLYIITREEGLL